MNNHRLTLLFFTIDTYSPQVTKPRQAIVARKTVTTDIGATQDDADALLKDELDRAMRKFRRRTRLSSTNTTTPG